MLSTLKVSDSMIIELMDNPEGVENVIFTADDVRYRIIDWGTSEGEGWWELQCKYGRLPAL